MQVLILEIISSWDIKNGQFQFLVTFLTVSSALQIVQFWSANYSSYLRPS